MDETLSEQNEEYQVIKADVPARNYVKIKVLVYLNRQFLNLLTLNEGELSAWAMVPAIADHTNTEPDSLRVILHRWSSHDWGYVDARRFTAEQMSDGRPHTLYKINKKGLSYLKRLDKWYPHVDAINRELDSIEANWNRVHVKSIVWKAYPGAKFEVISFNWPFRGKYDAIYRFYGGPAIDMLVEDINQAAAAARNLFKVNPSPECFNYALELMKYHGELNGFKVTVK